ncbi:aldehyde dehydrogenase (NADP(+)) [Micromonospora sp. NPDC048830]|uniref:aldehyde dehydrogenase (NADP(+)) n=1 Tax=Micromonospora sp. NPDC048830 TaxID=3364257 RepID=UPI003712D02F
MRPKIRGTSLVGFTDVAHHEGSTFLAIDPRTGAALHPPFAEASSADVARATTLAWRAFPRYRATGPDLRAAFLENIATGLEENRALITDRMVAETGLPAARADTEMTRTLGQLRLFAAVVRDGSWRQARIDPGDPDRVPVPRPDIRQRAVPLGPVAVFAAGNFPLAFSVAGGDTAAALAAGAPVIVKGHPGHPGTSELVGRVVREAVRSHDLPEGVFSLLQGASDELGEQLVTAPLVAAVAFTGSRAGGMALATAAQRRPAPIPVFAEMSAVNPVILLPDALHRRAGALAVDYVASVTGSMGQLCTKPGLVYVLDGPLAHRFLDSAAAALRAMPAGPMLTSKIAASYRRRLAEVTSLDGVGTVALSRCDGTAETFAAPHLLVTTGDVVLGQPTLSEEIFGPASVVVRVRDEAQLAELLRILPGQLTATMHVGDADDSLAAALIEELELIAGRVIVNGWPTGVEVCHAMVHGGPFPATSAAATTSVGSRAIERFLRPVAYQAVPERLLPPELRTDPPYAVPRLIRGVPEAVTPQLNDESVTNDLLKTN